MEAFFFVLTLRKSIIFYSKIVRLKLNRFIYQRHKNKNWHYLVNVILYVYDRDATSIDLPYRAIFKTVISLNIIKKISIKLQLRSI
jgi:hypothetical protein